MDLPWISEGPRICRLGLDRGGSETTAEPPAGNRSSRFLGLKTGEAVLIPGRGGYYRGPLGGRIRNAGRTRARGGPSLLLAKGGIQSRRNFDCRAFDCLGRRNTGARGKGQAGVTNLDTSSIHPFLCYRDCSSKALEKTALNYF